MIQMLVGGKYLNVPYGFFVLREMVELIGSSCEQS
jgi:hypothetical protein